MKHDTNKRPTKRPTQRSVTSIGAKSSVGHRSVKHRPESHSHKQATSSRGIPVSLETMDENGRLHSSRSHASSYAAENQAQRRSTYSSRGKRHNLFDSFGISSVQRNKSILIIVALIVVVILALMIGLAQCSNNTSSNADANLAGSAPLTTQEAQATTLTVTFAGDCTLGTDEAFNPSTSFNAVYDDVENPAYFLQNVADIFGADDLTIVNMEGTLTTSTTRADKTFAFKGPAEYSQVLTSSSVEAASVANNHSRDYGEQSLTDTIETLDAAGVQTFGYDRIAYLDVKGIKVALIGANALSSYEETTNQVTQQITEARNLGAQLVLVYIHWGIERDYIPSADQINLGHAAIDAGADLVVGSHPHVIQGYEQYQGRYIVYSLGNFCFGGNSNPNDKDCMIFQQTFTVQGDEVEKNDNVDFIACSISSTPSRNNYQPTPATGDEKTRIEKKIQDSTDQVYDSSI